MTEAEKLEALTEERNVLQGLLNDLRGALGQAELLKGKDFSDGQSGTKHWQFSFDIIAHSGRAIVAMLAARGVKSSMPTSEEAAAHSGVAGEKKVVGSERKLHGYRRMKLTHDRLAKLAEKELGKLDTEIAKLN